MIIPDLHDDLIDERELSLSIPSVLLKTHDSFEHTQKFIPNEKNHLARYIYIFRVPEDSLVSFYHFHRRYQNLKPLSADGIDAFCLGKLEEWKSNIEGYIEAKLLCPERVFFVSYERMQSDPLEMINASLNWLGIRLPSHYINRALANSSFKNLRAKEERNPINKNEFFFRKGRTGSGQEELKPTTIRKIRDTTFDTFAKANSFIKL